MQLRKRSNVVNYTENGSPRASRLLKRGDSAASLDIAENSDSEEENNGYRAPAHRRREAEAEEGEASSGTEKNSDPSDSDVRPRKRRALTAKSSRKNHGARKARKDGDVLVYRKRNAENGYQATSETDQDDAREDVVFIEDDDNNFVEVKPKKRKIPPEPSSNRSLRARRAEAAVNYKDATSSDEEDDAKVKSGLKDNDEDDEDEEDGDEEAEEDVRESPRRSSYRNGKMRRVAAPSTDSAESLPGNADADDVKCYSRRLKNEEDRGADSTVLDDKKLSSSEGEPVAAAKELVSKPFSYIVDKFGLKDCENDYGPITKRVTRVEKVLAVRNRASGAPIYCVKLPGKSYRCVVNVHEEQLMKCCPLLLRSFLKRMDSLGRVDGHPGDIAESPAFSPKCLKVDRIIAVEKHKRWTHYYVKWCGLSYSESTWEKEEDLTGDGDAIKRYRNFNRRSRKKQIPSELVFKDGRSLRDYQEEGLSWLDDKYENGVSCILADEMGLGKTIQSVAMLETLRIKRGIHGPFLVVAPVSTLGHWQREVETLTDMNCVVYSGNQEDREIIRQYEFTYDGADSSDIKFNILLTSFEILMKDQNKLAKVNWQFVIVDEAHRLKSRESKTSLSLKQMEVPRGGLLLLTGTPVQNSTKEIFSLLYLLDSNLFASEDEFLAKYGDLRNAEQVKDLQDNVLRPRLLRRMKEDVEKTIPLKEETIVWVELTKQQWIYYRAIFEKNIGTLLKGSSSSNVPNLRNVAMELRKVCNHPLLCDGVEEDLTRKLGAPPTGQSSAIGGTDRNASLKLLQQSSGKMILVDKLLPMLKEAGNRVLIFSQFTMMLDLLEDYLNHKGYTYERIDGTIRGADRQAAIDRYSAHGSDRFVFLLSTRAGGLGITLTAADTCLIYDSDWNPQNDLQAMARCHRIGQTKDVRIYRLITSKTYEQKLFEVSSRKYGLDEAILGNRLGAAADVEQSLNIETLLKNGAYDMMKDDGGAASDNFNTSNIHEILAHRTQKRSIGGRGTNTFSVTTFISQSEMENEANDERKQKLGKGAEEFWQELLPGAVEKSKATAENKAMVADTKRKRVRVDYREDLKQVSDDDTYENSSGQESQSDDGSGSEASDEGNGFDSWPEREVKRLEDRLMALGRNRSAQIQQEAKLEHRTLSQIEQVSEFLVQFCHYEVTVQAARARKDPQATQASRASPQVPQDAQVSPAPHPGLISKFSQATATQATATQAKETQATSGKTPDERPNGNGQMPGVGIKSPEGEQFGICILQIQHEPVPEILREGTLLLNNEESGVNYRKSGCFVIGDTRRPSPPACIRKLMKSKAMVDRLAKNASRYLQTLLEREVLAFAIAKNDSRSFPPKVPIRSKKIPSWWGEQEDRDFLIGVNKHGHREFKKTRADTTLCFAKRMNAPRPATQSVPQTAAYPGQPPIYHMQPSHHSQPTFLAEQRSYPMQHVAHSGHQAHDHPGQVPYQGQPGNPGQFGYPGYSPAYPGYPPYFGQPTTHPYPGQPPAYPGQPGFSAQLGHPNLNPNSTVESGDDWPADLVLQSRLKKLIQMLPKQNGPDLCELSKYHELNSKAEKSTPVDSRGNAEKSESVTEESSVKETPREAAIRRVKLEVEKLRWKTQAPMSAKVIRDVCLKGQ